MSIETLDPKLRRLIEPYFKGQATANLDHKLIGDLGVTGSDYLDFIGDVEKTFRIDLTDFLTGPSPEYVPRGCIGTLLGRPPKPILRDVSIRDLANYLAGAPRA